MQTNAPFSQRFKHSRAKPISVRDQAPAELRVFVDKAIRHFYPYKEHALELVCLAVGKIPYKTVSDYLRDEWESVKKELQTAPWYRVYDVLERLYLRIRSNQDDDASDLVSLANIFFEENGYSYRMSSAGKVEYRGDESFEVATLTANLALGEAGLETARREIHAALEDLGKRPNPDLTGAVQHAMAGLECAAKELVNEPKLELGKIIKKHGDLFPPPLGEVLTQLYGYASNNGRHLTEGGEPQIAEVELVVGVASTAATYLARKRMG